MTRRSRLSHAATLASRAGDVLGCSEHAEGVLAGELGQVGPGPAAVGEGGEEPRIPRHILQSLGHPLAPHVVTPDADMVHAGDRTHVLDVCHEMIKPKMVDSSLMVGQFHSKCETRGIHNSAWNAISRSPIPLMAMRHMVIHDVMFLEDNEAWFRAYDANFGARFAERGKCLSAYQKHLFTCYERAKAKHAGR